MHVKGDFDAFRTQVRADFAGGRFPAQPGGRALLVLPSSQLRCREDQGNEPRKDSETTSQRGQNSLRCKTLEFHCKISCFLLQVTLILYLFMFSTGRAKESRSCEEAQRSADLQ